MKTIKITLAIIVVAAICAAVIKGIGHLPHIIKETTPPDTRYTIEINNYIDTLKSKPDNKISKDFYEEIAFKINVFHKNGKFGQTQSDNDQWKDNLERNLYTVYTDKFIKYAKTIFNGSEWKNEDLQFIQNEKNELKKSKLLNPGDPTDKDFTDIQNTLNKYSEIVNFINECYGYGFAATLLSARFPIADVQSKISRTDSLLNNGMGNQYVNNCIRLQESLKEIPQRLFRAHVRYFDNKINYWSGMYSNFNSHKDYSNNLYIPLKTEIEEMDNDIYNVSNFDNEYDRLMQKWSNDNTKAYYYFSR